MIPNCNNITDVFQSLKNKNPDILSEYKLIIKKSESIFAYVNIRKKEIKLSETIIKQYSLNIQTAILLHEIGHVVSYKDLQLSFYDEVLISFLIAFPFNFLIIFILQDFNILLLILYFILKNILEKIFKKTIDKLKKPEIYADYFVNYLNYGYYLNLFLKTEQDSENPLVMFIKKHFLLNMPYYPTLKERKSILINKNQKMDEYYNQKKIII